MQPAQKNKPTQLYERYRQLIKTHLTDLVKGNAESMLNIEDFADQLCIHPTHLSNTMKAVTGTSACGVLQLEIGHLAKELLMDPTRTVQEVALLLDFEPSQFTKWFKRIYGMTPKTFRQGQLLKS
ncbi:AraC family transcriptional regulator [Spirosoma sp. KNUC1025]|uniref:helix-turn-helix domain-containing protein n=1 Tax=Spirosoma sp. KNUC1025 TaxID=2894082 RepID=UPI001E387120|nr:helix-turn-helix transcriptional regulator [Spirosoma sp. KNUC1025]UFH57599.1 helix-turn-helix transcriptional regulator [Spirosoma sp. KNUC1025]